MKKRRFYGRDADVSVISYDILFTMSGSRIAFYSNTDRAHGMLCIGQDRIVKILRAAIKGKSIGHAYLFTGSRADRKTSGRTHFCA